MEEWQSSTGTAPPDHPATRVCPGCAKTVKKHAAATGECHRCRAKVHNEKYHRSVVRRGRTVFRGSFWYYKTALTYLEQLRRWGMEGYRVQQVPLGWQVVEEER